MNTTSEKRIFANNLTKYVNQSGKMQIDVAKDLDVPIQTFNGWCNGVSIPSMGKVQKIADYFHIGKSDLLDEKGYDVFAFTDEEKILIECYRELGDTEKNMVKRLMAYEEYFRKFAKDKKK